MNAGAPGRLIRVLLRWLVRLLGLAIAAIVLAAVAVVVVIPRATHSQAMTVLTGSMTPGIPVGSIVMVRPTDPNTLRVGDVATYEQVPGKGFFITHRIVKIDSSKSPTRFTFKGDANRGADINPVVSRQVRGKVWFHVPYLGAIRDGLHGKGGITLWAMLLLAGYALSQVGAGLRERKEKVHVRPVAFPTNRCLVAVTIATDRLTSRIALSPAQAATAWGGVLVHEDEDSCTIVLGPADEPELTARLEELASFEPRRMLVVDGPITVTGQEVDAARRDGSDRVQA